MVYQNGRYAVTGQTGLFKTKHESYRVVNMETRKLASAEFANLREALFHADSLVLSQRPGVKK
jgi:hypothetical protein